MPDSVKNEAGIVSDVVVVIDVDVSVADEVVPEMKGVDDAAAGAVWLGVVECDDLKVQKPKMEKLIQTLQDPIL